MTEFILLPGINGSGEKHWQTRWERSHPNMHRFQPADWDYPDLSQWIEALDRSVAAAKRPCVLVAHSLACLLVAHWNRVTQHKVQGAFLVSVPDPAAAAFPMEAAGFADVPEHQLSFPSLIVASTNDPFATADYTTLRARQWACDVVVAGALGHINAASGLGEWPEGFELLMGFVAKTGK